MMNNFSDIINESIDLLNDSIKLLNDPDTPDFIKEHILFFLKVVLSHVKK